MTTSTFDVNGVPQASVTAASSFWGGLSGTFSVTNTSAQALSGWSFSFVSKYNAFKFYIGEESAQFNSDGTYTITVRAAAGAPPLAAGARLDLGFTVDSDSDPTVTLEEVVLVGTSAGSGGGTTGGTPGGTIEALRLVGYFEEWGIYGREFRVADVRADQLTHLNDSFFGITPTQSDRPFMAPELNVLPGAMVQDGDLGLNSNTPGGLGIHDTWAAYEKTFTQADQLVSRRFVASQW